MCASAYSVNEDQAAQIVCSDLKSSPYECVPEIT